MVIDSLKVKRILCIKLRGIGDVVLATVVLKNLKRQFPDAEIDFLTEPPSDLILETNPLINKIILYKKKEKFGGLKTIRSVFKNRYDLVIDLYSNPRTAFITFASFAKYRAGFPYKGRGYAYNLHGSTDRITYHSADLNLMLLGENGIPVICKEIIVAYTRPDKEFAENFLSSHNLSSENVVCISPSGGWPSKKCDPVKFAEIADAITAVYNVKTLIVWGPKDKHQAEEIQKLMKSDSVMAPPTKIRQMGALMSKCSFVVSNDSGPMHIAAASSVPVLALHGPTNPRLQGPYGKKHDWVRNENLDCICCNLLECPKKHECFLDLPVANVLNKVEILINKNKINIKKR